MSSIFFDLADMTGFVVRWRSLVVDLNMNGGSACENILAH